MMHAIWYFIDVPMKYGPNDISAQFKVWGTTSLMLSARML